MEYAHSLSSQSCVKCGLAYLFNPFNVLHYSRFIDYSQGCKPAIYYKKVLLVTKGPLNVIMFYPPPPEFFLKYLFMIVYTPFWNTLKKKNLSTYALIHKYKMSSSTIDRLRRNLPVSTTTLNDLCRFLNCSVSEIIEYVEDR